MTTGRTLAPYWFAINAIGEFRCEAGWIWSPAFPMPDYDLWYAVSGIGQMTVNADTFRIQQGTCFLLRPGDRIYATHDPVHRLTVISIHFSPYFLNQAASSESAELPVLPNRRYQVDDTKVFEGYLKQLLEIKDRPYTESDHEIDCLLKLLLLDLLRTKEKPDLHLSRGVKQKQLIRSVVAYLRDHLDKPLAHERLADEFRMSPRYLNRLFKAHTGSSIKAYFSRMRLERAQFLLTETPLTISDIAEALGFYDVYFFSKTFKKSTGLSPSAYRLMPSHTGDSEP